MNKNSRTKISILIVGNKSDLSNERVVPIDEIKKIIWIKYSFINESAKNENNIVIKQKAKFK